MQWESEKVYLSDNYESEEAAPVSNVMTEVKTWITDASQKISQILMLKQKKSKGNELKQWHWSWKRYNKRLI